MAQKTSLSSSQSLPHRGRGWLRALVLGAVLFVAATAIMLLTGNLNLYPTVILIGNFLVPIVFVAFLYDHQQISVIAPETVASSFCLGGILGVLGASILESLLLPASPNPTQGLSLSGAFAIGLIEEGCKIAVLAFLARRMRHDSQMDGLLLGGAVGMGFAAFESTGYAFMALLLSHGYVGASILETIIRGLLAPFGHGVWTGILGAVLFHQSRPNRFRITGSLILTYLFVSILHGFWDGLSNTVFVLIPPGISFSITTLIIGVIGLATLSVLYQRAMHQHMQRLAFPFSEKD
jgi:RsiW-degrading membrane proteinase PrsW (M82 family)